MFPLGLLCSPPRPKYPDHNGRLKRRALPGTTESALPICAFGTDAHGLPSPAPIAGPALSRLARANGPHATNVHDQARQADNIASRWGELFTRSEGLSIKVQGSLQQGR